jgi:hypothetical protein
MKMSHKDTAENAVKEGVYPRINESYIEFLVQKNASYMLNDSNYMTL